MIQTLFIGFTMLVFALVVYAFVDCVTSRSRRWPVWALFILLGFCPISLDMTSGDARLDLLSAVLLGAKIVRNTQGGSPGWILSFGVPLGALLWLGRNRLTSRQAISGNRMDRIH
jgi:hypothetical protein